MSLPQQLQRTLFVVATSERANEIKKEFVKKYTFLEVLTLPQLIAEIFEVYDQNRAQLPSQIVPSLFYKIIQDEKIEYFDYIVPKSRSLDFLYDFFKELALNEVSLQEFGYTDEKLEALEKLQTAYNNFKSDQGFADYVDSITLALDKAENFLKRFESVFVDRFDIGDIALVGSKNERKLLKLIKNSASSFPKTTKVKKNAKLYHNRAFDSYNEVRVALKIAKKLMLQGASEDEIVIVTSDFGEYQSLFYNLLDEYGMVGYDTEGIPLYQFSQNDRILKHHPLYPVQQKYWEYEEKFMQTFTLAKEFGFKIDEDTLRDNIKQTLKVANPKEGILFTEPNKFIGLQNGYKHIIFIGSDITHFPPKQNKNFLYSQTQATELFGKNTLFKASKTLYDEMKRLADNLYIITASYKGKRPLVPSIIIDKNLEAFDVLDIQSKRDILLQNKRFEDDTFKAYQQSIASDNFTKFDGVDVGTFTQGNKLSASAINIYVKCPMQYYFSYILGLQSPQNEEEGFDSAGLGNLLHKCFELFVNNPKPHTLQKQELYDYMYEISEQAYEDEEIQAIIGMENIKHKIALANLQKGLDDIESKDKAQLAKFVDYYVENGFDDFKNSFAEEQFMLDENFAVVEPLDEHKRFIKGFIDRLDNLSENVNIIDYKSSLNSYKRDDFLLDEKHPKLKNFQLGIYMLYASQKYPNKKSNAHLVSFKEEQAKFIALNSDKFDDFYQTEIKKQIKDVQNSINSGMFPYNNTDEKVCQYCSFTTLCHQAVLDKEIADEQE